MATRTHEFTNELIATRENERRRIACELHDSIGQRLCALKFRLEVDLKTSNERREETQTHVLESAIQNIQETLTELHRIALDLRPLGLDDDIGFLHKLDVFCRDYVEAHPRVNVIKRYRVEDIDLPMTLKVVVYRIVQEAFNNIAKHAGADQVSLELQKTDFGMRLAVTDNGTGFDLREHTGPAAEKAGLGLESMNERASSTGGKLTIRPRSGGGTVVEALWSTSALAHLAGN